MAIRGCSPEVQIIEMPPPIIMCNPERSVTPSFTGVVPVLLGPGNWATNQPFRLIDGVTVPITSLDLVMPVCDGVLLQSGSEGQSANAAMFVSGAYSTPLALPGNFGDILWLGQVPGPMVAVMPTFAAGDKWSLPVARKSTSRMFVFAPDFPIQL